MLRRLALVRTEVSEEPSAFFIRLTRIGELGTTLAATSNRRTMRRNISSQRNISEDTILLNFKQANSTTYSAFYEQFVTSALTDASCALVPSLPVVLAVKH
jgi:hypothetical protein